VARCSHEQQNTSMPLASPRYGLKRSGVASKRLQAIVPLHRGIVQWLTNVRTILVRVVACDDESVKCGERTYVDLLTGWAVVANGEIRGHITADVGETL